MSELFSDQFLATIARLSLDVRPAPPRPTVGAHLSRRTGASLEFRDFQAYTPGDDLRRVDWNVYGRTRHLFVRRFERPTNVPVYVLVDASESMRLETPSRYTTAARVAAAILSASISSQNPAYLTVADGGGAAAPRALTSRRGFVQALADLAATRRVGGAGIAADLSAMLPFLATKGRGVLVVLSDFFEPRGIDALLDVLRLIDQKLVMVRVTQPHDADPTRRDNLELVDCETGDRMTVSSDAESLARYRDAYRTYFSILDEHATARGATTATVDAASPTLPQLQGLFVGGVMRV